MDEQLDRLAQARRADARLIRQQAMKIAAQASEIHRRGRALAITVIIATGESVWIAAHIGMEH